MKAVKCVLLLLHCAHAQIPTLFCTHFPPRSPADTCEGNVSQPSLWLRYFSSFTTPCAFALPTSIMNVTHYLSPIVAPPSSHLASFFFATRLQHRASSKLEFQSCTRRQQPHRRQRAPMLVRTSWIWETCLHMTPLNSISSLTQATFLARLDMLKKSVYPEHFYKCRCTQLNYCIIYLK